MHRIALLQLAPRLGDLDGNLRRLEEALREANGAGTVDAAVYSGLALAGYPVEGLAFRAEFSTAWRQARSEAAGRFTFGPLPDGMIRLSDGVFPDLGESGPAAKAAEKGAKAVLVDSARPYRLGHPARYEADLSAFARRHRVWWLEANLAGAANETVMAGGSLVVDPGGAVRLRAAFGSPDLAIFGLEPDYSDGRPLAGRMAPLPSEPEALHDALVLAIASFVQETRLAGAVLGLSGGIDSAVVAALAVQALGPDRVVGLTLPSVHTSPETLADAWALARNLGMVCHQAPIDPLCREAAGLLDPLFAKASPAPPADPDDITGQNVQARMRAVLLMAYANRYGLLLLNTSNKSEASVGYGTLYGDMAGGYGPLIDVYKTGVWDLARAVNRRMGAGTIPESTILRPPTAELRPGQLDSDSIPPYETIDGILQKFGEKAGTVEDVVASGFDPAQVARTVRLYINSEHKRRQAAPGPRVQPSADWPERRLPANHRFFPPYLAAAAAAAPSKEATP